MLQDEGCGAGAHSAGHAGDAARHLVYPDRTDSVHRRDMHLAFLDPSSSVVECSLRSRISWFTPGSAEGTNIFLNAAATLFRLTPPVVLTRQSLQELA